MTAGINKLCETVEMIAFFFSAKDNTGEFAGLSMKKMTFLSFLFQSVTIPSTKKPRAFATNFGDTLTFSSSY